MKFFQTLAEGGQTWAHRVRMVKQVIKLGLFLSFLVAAVYFFYLISQVNELSLQSGWYDVKSRIFSYYTKEITVSHSFWENITHVKSSSEEIKVSITRLQALIKPYVASLKIEGEHIAYKALCAAFVTFISMQLFFLVRGTASKRKKHVKGKRLVNPFLLALKLRLKRQASEIKIANLPLVKGTETQHILVTGGTGSGKTNCFHHILPQIRTQKQRAIIIDTSGVFIERYFDSSKDVLFNPFDTRSAPWHPWAECHDQFDYDALAESFIPQSYHDNENYWRTAARSLFSAVLQKTKNSQQTSELSRWLLFEPLNKLAAFVQGTKAAAHIDINSEKTAASIRSVASSFLSCLEHLKDTWTPFSVRDWVENGEGWLFLYCKPAQRASLNPLLSCWFSVAVRGLIQMDVDLDRRLWFVIDELPTLFKLKELGTLITESRKYGGCGLLAIQSPSQLEEIYGRAFTQTIIGNCGTKVIFAEHDSEISERISKALGETEVKEYQEGISYGAHEVRDGVNLSLQSKKLPIVSATEIQFLEKNHAYVKLPGNLPVSKVKLSTRRKK